jgi:hypothetical protein
MDQQRLRGIDCTQLGLAAFYNDFEPMLWGVVQNEVEGIICFRFGMKPGPWRGTSSMSRPESAGRDFMASLLLTLGLPVFIGCSLRPPPRDIPIYRAIIGKPGRA